MITLMLSTFLSLRLFDSYNNYHHDYFHNMRLIIDPWKGKITQLIADPIINSLATNH